MSASRIWNVTTYKAVEFIALDIRTADSSGYLAKDRVSFESIMAQLMATRLAHFMVIQVARVQLVRFHLRMEEETLDTHHRTQILPCINFSR